MKLYLVQENHIIHPEKYLCFGYKALKEFASSYKKSFSLFL